MPQQAMVRLTATTFREDGAEAPAAEVYREFRDALDGHEFWVDPEDGSESVAYQIRVDSFTELKPSETEGDTINQGEYDPLPENVSGYHTGEEPGTRHVPATGESITVTPAIKARLHALVGLERPDYSVAIGILLDNYQQV
jgi:hypothetical protein